MQVLEPNDKSIIGVSNDQMLWISFILGCCCYCLWQSCNRSCHRLESVRWWGYRQWAEWYHTWWTGKVVSKCFYMYLNDEIASLAEISQKPHSNHLDTQTLNALAAPVRVGLGYSKHGLDEHGSIADHLSKISKGKDLNEKSHDCHDSHEAQNELNWMASISTVFFVSFPSPEPFPSFALTDSSVRDFHTLL